MKIRLLATSDVHGYVTPFSYANRKEVEGGLVKIATQVDERTNTNTNSSGSTTSVTIVEEPIVVKQNGEEKPLVLMEILPVVKGVVVVAEGAKDISVRLNLLEAVQSLLGLDSKSVQILTGV